MAAIGVFIALFVILILILPIVAIYKSVITSRRLVEIETKLEQLNQLLSNLSYLKDSAVSFGNKTSNEQGITTLLEPLTSIEPQTSNNDITPNITNETNSSLIQDEIPETRSVFQDNTLYTKTIETISDTNINNDLIDNLTPTLATRNTASMPSLSLIKSSDPQQSTPHDEVIKDNHLISLFKWFFYDNPIAKIGILLLFIGLGFLLKYSVEHSILSIEIRLIMSAVTSLVLLILGWKLRHKKTLYSLILQGGAVGIFYITILASVKFYTILPFSIAFVMLIVICLTSSALAILQRAMSLAIIGSIGGYLAPILISTHTGNYIGFFSYYILLSTGILLISIWQSWRILNLIGFSFTYFAAFLWGYNYYTLDNYLPCQILLFINMLIFGVLTIIDSLRNTQQGNNWCDVILLFGTPLLSFTLQYVITSHWSYGPAFSALGYGLFYLVITSLLLKRYPHYSRTLVMAFLAVGVGFVTLAIPFALSTKWTAIVWLLEGTCITWIGLLQKQRRFIWGGTAIVVLGIGSSYLAAYYQLLIKAYIKFSLVSFSMLFSILLLCCLVVGYLWQRYKPENTSWKLVSLFFLIAGIVSWFILVIMIVLVSPENIQALLKVDMDESILTFALISILIPLSVALWHIVAKRTGWQALGNVVWLLWPVMIIYFITQYIFLSFYVITFIGFWDVIVSNGTLLVITAYLLLRYVGEEINNIAVRSFLHVSALWCLLSLFVIPLFYWLLPYFYYEWSSLILVFFIAICLLTVTILFRKSIWPVINYRRSYLIYGMLPLIIPLILSLFDLNYSSGKVFLESLSCSVYLPLVNPLEEVALFSLLALIFWYRCAFNEKIKWERIFKRYIVKYSGWILIFLWVNGCLLRGIAEYDSIPWQADALWRSRLVQSVLSLFWSAVAFACMLIAGKTMQRKQWFYGAGILAVVLLKLLLVDSVDSNSLVRAITFIGVSILALLSAYFVPLPPQAQNNTAKDL